MKYHLDFTEKDMENITALKKSRNKIVLNKSLPVLKELTAHPLTKTGKPEPLSVTPKAVQLYLASLKGIYHEINTASSTTAEGLESY